MDARVVGHVTEVNSRVTMGAVVDKAPVRNPICVSHVPHARCLLSVSQPAERNLRIMMT